MWQGASETKLAATRGYGAAVDLEATGPAEAFERLWQLMDETGRTLVHPHSDPVVVAGAGTVGLEIEEDAPDADAVIVAVGGGGLIAGITAAIGDRMRIVAVEPETSCALPRRDRGRPSGPGRADLDRRRPQRADARRPAVRAVPPPRARARDRGRDRGRVPLPLQRAKLAVRAERGAAAAAALLTGKVQAERPVVVVSGGNVATETAAAILARP